MFYWQSDRPYTHQQINEIFLQRRLSYKKEELIEVIQKVMHQKVVKLDPPINQGSVNLVCPFVLSNDFEGVIRVHPPQANNSYFHVEKLVMDLASKNGVPTAEVLTVDDTREIAPFDYMIMTKIQGEVLRVTIEHNPDIHPIYLNQIGKYMALIHQISTVGYGFFDNNLAAKGVLRGQYLSNEDHYQSALDLDKHFHFKEDVHFDIELVEKSFQILERNIKVAECKNPVLIHNDIADWNTVVSNNIVTGIMDWDECFSGDPVFEFATLGLFYDGYQMKEILDGYKKILDLPPDFNDKIDLYTLRYIINKSKIALTKIKYAEKTSMHAWLAGAKDKLIKIIEKIG